MAKIALNTPEHVTLRDLRDLGILGPVDSELDIFTRE